MNNCETMYYIISVGKSAPLKAEKYTIAPRARQGFDKALAQGQCMNDSCKEPYILKVVYITIDKRGMHTVEWREWDRDKRKWGATSWARSILDEYKKAIARYTGDEL